MSEIKDSNREDVAKSAMDHQHAHMLRPDVDDALLRRNKALWAHSSWHGRFASAMQPGSGGGGGFDEELNRLRETNLLLSEECSALKEVLSTANLAASGECSRLREQVSTLFRENCSLKEHSAKVAIESKALKKQLATSNKENAVLRHRLAQFSQQLKSVAKTNTPTNAIANDYSCVVEDADIDCGLVKSSVVDINSMTSATAQQPLEGSLEQISQQLLVHLQREKLELEQQYTQMVKIQNSPSSSGACGDVHLLNLSVSAENLDEMTSLMKQMDTCRSSSRLLVREATIQNRLLSALVEQFALTDTLQKVAKQQLGEPPPSALSSQADSSKRDIQPKLLDVDDKARSRDHAAAKSSSRTSLDELLDMYDNDEKQHAEDEVLQVNDEERIQKTLTPVHLASPVATLDNRVCPMCHAVFPISVPLHEFEAHVMEHFRGEDFEIIMHDADDDDQESDGTPLGGGYH